MIYFRSLTVIMILFLCRPTLGQEIIQSVPQKLSSKYDDYEVLGENDFGIIVHYYAKNSHLLETYNEKLRPKYRAEINLKEKRAYVEQIIPFQKFIGVFYNTISNNHSYLKFRKLNSKLQASDNFVLLDSVQINAFDPNINYFVKTSEDKTKILVFNFFHKGNKTTVNYKVFDNDFNLLSKQATVVEGKEDKSLKSMKVSNNGDVITVIGHYDNRRNEEYDYNIFKYTITCLNSRKGNVETFEIQKEDYLFKNLITKIDEENNLVVMIGGYTHKKEATDLGFFSKKISFISNLNTNAYIAHKEEDIEGSTSYNFRKWEDKASIIRPKRIIIRSDGGFILVAESEYQYTQLITSPASINDPFGYSNNYTTYYDKNYFYDIFAYSIDPGNTVDWKVKIPKVQETESDAGKFSSFCFFEANNALKFVFSEDVYVNGNIVEYNLNPKGEYNRNSLFNSQKLDLIPLIREGKQISKNRIVIPSEKRRNLQLVILKY